MDQPKKCADNAGECLRQTGYGYYNDNGCNCTVVPCPNHFLCGNSHPKWFLGCHGGRCLNCNMHFGSPNLTLVPHHQSVWFAQKFLFMFKYLGVRINCASIASIAFITVIVTTN